MVSFALTRTRFHLANESDMKCLQGIPRLIGELRCGASACIAALPALAAKSVLSQQVAHQLQLVKALVSLIWMLAGVLRYCQRPLTLSKVQSVYPMALTTLPEL